MPNQLVPLPKPNVADMVKSALAEHGAIERLMQENATARNAELALAAQRADEARARAASKSRANARLYRKYARDEAKEQAPQLVQELLLDLLDNIRREGVHAAYLSTGARYDDTVGELAKMLDDCSLDAGDPDHYLAAISPRPWISLPRCRHTKMLKAVTHERHEVLEDYRRERFCEAIAAELQGQPLALVRYCYRIGNGRIMEYEEPEFEAALRPQSEVQLVALDADGNLAKAYDQPLSGHWQDGELVTFAPFAWQEPELLKRY